MYHAKHIPNQKVFKKQIEKYHFIDIIPYELEHYVQGAISPCPGVEKVG